MKRRFTDSELVQRLRSNDERQHDQALTYLYETQGSRIIQLIVRKGGTRQDGEEMLGNALFGLFTNVRAGTYQLQPTARLATYVGTLAINNWLKRVRKTKHWLGKTGSLEEEEAAGILQNEPDADEWQELFRELIGQLGEKCRALLEAFVDGFTMQEIAQKLGLGSADNAKARKYNCLKKLGALRTKP